MRTGVRCPQAQTKSIRSLAIKFITDFRWFHGGSASILEPDPKLCKLHLMYRTFLLAISCALFLFACQKDETISGLTSPTETWHLTSLNGTVISEPVTLTFPEKGRIAGQAPCNSYFATQTAPLPWFEVGPIGATKRACPSLALEGRYFQALAAANLIERQGDVLLLSGEGVTLEFRL